MKVLRGLIGIILSESGQTRLFFTATELAHLAQEATGMIHSSSSVWYQHYELSESLMEYLGKQVDKLTTLIFGYLEPFTFEDAGLKIS